jgi:hypothetical protein
MTANTPVRDQQPGLLDVAGGSDFSNGHTGEGDAEVERLSLLDQEWLETSSIDDAEVRPGGKYP